MVSIYEIEIQNNWMCRFVLCYALERHEAYHSYFCTTIVATKMVYVPNDKSTYTWLQQKVCASYFSMLIKVIFNQLK